MCSDHFRMGNKISSKPKFVESIIYLVTDFFFKLEECFNANPNN